MGNRLSIKSTLVRDISITSFPVAISVGGGRFHFPARISTSQKLRGWPMREHTKVENEHVTEFCAKATSVLKGVRELQQKLRMNGRKQETAETGEDTSPLPEIVKQGPTERAHSELESAELQQA
jgi:hypothetical protein